MHAERALEGLPGQNCSLDPDIKKAVPPEKTSCHPPSPHSTSVDLYSLQPEQPKLTSGLLQEPWGWEGEAPTMPSTAR